MVSLSELLTSHAASEKLTREQQRAKGRLIDGLFENVYNRFTDNSIEHTLSQGSQTGAQLQTVYFFSDDLNGVMKIVNVPSPNNTEEELLLVLDFKKKGEGVANLILRIGGDSKTAKFNHNSLLSGYSATQIALIDDLVKAARPSTLEEYKYHFPQPI